MARSRRRTPIASITTAATEKQDKRWANRKRLARHGGVRNRMQGHGSYSHMGVGDVGCRPN